ncbi:hypothetical protein R3P38DRAFT_3173224 [Favolaschia claudopus]|uniref:Uncharacterized protein n=1 Tax=Favolaschia claudopus TaxID=2862362 RepID=A0AAW0DE13_9AGAR
MSDTVNVAPPDGPANPVPPDGSDDGPANPVSPDGSDDDDPPPSSHEDQPSGPQIVRLEKIKRKRHRRGDKKAKPGKPPWVHGTKKTFLAKRRDEWLRESEAGRAGSFYTKMAKLYVKKYGCDLKDDEDLAVDVEDPPDEAANEVVHDIPADEATKQSDCVKKMRGRIGQWYRGEYGNIAKSEKQAFKEIFTGVLDGSPAKPHRGRLIHFYSRKYYETRVKHQVEERLEALERVAARTGEAKPKHIDVISKVTAESWEAESPAFKHECEVAFAKEHEQAVKAWKAALPDSPTRTPEEMAASLDNAAFYLQPFVDAIHERFGMCATVLLAGPIGRHGGKIGVQSVHAGVTRGLAPVNWPTFDWRGFQDVETSMVGFAKEVYTQAECDARACQDETPAPAVRSAPPAATTGMAPPPVPAMDPPPPAGTPAEPPVSPAVPPRSSTPSSDPPHSPAPAVPPQDTMPPMGDKPEQDRTPDDDDDERTPSDDERDAEEVEARHREEEDDKWLGREDRVEWTTDLVSANRSFAGGRGWEDDWILCVKKFFDFEAAWGFQDGENIPPVRTNRPVEIGGWVNRGRVWGLPPSVGMMMGRRSSVGQAASLWVPRWWVWWRMMQPTEREEAEDGSLTRPEVADWSTMAKMYGKNGLVLVMASLYWWGCAAHRFDGDDREEWLAGVRDVTWVLERLLESGEISGNRTEPPEGEHNDEEKGEESDKGEEGSNKPNKRKRGAGVELETEGEEGGRKKKARKKRDTVAPRRTPRLRGEAAASTARATRSSTSKGDGKRPQPKATYRGRR